MKDIGRYFCYSVKRMLYKAMLSAAFGYEASRLVSVFNKKNRKGENLTKQAASSSFVLLQDKSDVITKLGEKMRHLNLNSLLL